MTIQSKSRKGGVLMGLDRHLAELVDILKMEIRSFNSVMELLILEEKCLVSCDTPGLADVTERQGDVLSSVACLEKSRLDVLQKIKRETGRNGLTIDDLAKLAAGDIRKELVEAGKILAYIYEDMKRKKVSNNLLIRQGIMMVENDIRLIMNVCGGKDGKLDIYSPGPEKTTRRGGMYIDGTV